MKTKIISPLFLAGLIAGAGPSLAQNALEASATNQVDSSGMKGVEYKLSPSDIISIEVFQEPDLTIEQLRIQADGTVRYPLLGEVEIAGLTPSDAADKIRALLAEDYIRNPHVILQAVQYNDRKISVQGAVNQPNVVNMPPGQKWTIMEAIAATGGFSKVANKNKIRLIRPGEEERVFSEDELREMASTNDPNQVYLQPGDQIVVAERRF